MGPKYILFGYMDLRVSDPIKSFPKIQRVLGYCYGAYFPKS